MISSICAGIAGIYAASRSGNIVSSTGVGLEFTVLTALVLGGASLFGGRGSLIKSVTGLFFFALLANGFIMYNMEPIWIRLATGVILLGVLIFDSRINREKLEY